MRIKGKRLKKLYGTLSNMYEYYVGSKFQYKSGEKGRVKNIFTYVCESMGARDEKEFEEALRMFAKYISTKTEEWLRWDKRSRKNYLGFLEKPDEIEVYVSGELKVSEQNLDIAGTQEEDEWDF